MDKNSRGRRKGIKTLKCSNNQIRKRYNRKEGKGGSIDEEKARNRGLDHGSMDNVERKENSVPKCKLKEDKEKKRGVRKRQEMTEFIQKTI